MITPFVVIAMFMAFFVVVLIGSLRAEREYAERIEAEAEEIRRRLAELKAKRKLEDDYPPVLDCYYRYADVASGSSDLLSTRPGGKAH